MHAMESTMEQPCRRLAVIGTAGRDAKAPMSADLWRAMVADVRTRVRADDVLVSGGAAWADHLAVHAFLQGWVARLELYLPAPMVCNDYNANAPFFAGPQRSSGNAANYYHLRFRAVAGVASLSELGGLVREMPSGFAWDAQPVEPGYAAMYRRNALVASRCTDLLAYTFGPGDQPADGGTAHTWRLASHARRVHVPLGLLCSALAL